jgi:hypothetical protein
MDNITDWNKIYIPKMVFWNYPARFDRHYYIIGKPKFITSLHNEVGIKTAKNDIRIL